MNATSADRSTAAEKNLTPAPKNGARPRSDSLTATKFMPPISTIAMNAARALLSPDLACSIGRFLLKDG